MRAAIVDWCTATFAMEAERVPELLRALAFATGYEVQGAERRALNGFSDGLVVHAWVNRQFVELLTICWGGDQQRGRMMVDIRGSSCGMIDWPAMRDFLESLPESRLTRVDVAVDCLEGEFGVDDAMGWVEAGRFTLRGRTPSTRVEGDWLPVLQGRGPSTDGRTLYVGKAKNGKSLRVYEKGKQLRDARSDWVRFEVQFGNRDRELPFDILTDPGRFFVGAYPVLVEVLEYAAERIPTIQTTAEVTIGCILAWLKSSAGKWLNVLNDAGIKPVELVDELRVVAIPRRVQASAVAESVLPGAVKAGFEKWRASCLGNVSR